MTPKQVYTSTQLQDISTSPVPPPQIVIKYESGNRPEVVLMEQETPREVYAQLVIKVLKNLDGTASYYADVTIGDKVSQGTCGVPGMSPQKALAVARKEAGEFYKKFLHGTGYTTRFE